MVAGVGGDRESGQRAAGLWSRADQPPDCLDRKLVVEGWRGVVGPRSPRRVRDEPLVPDSGSSVNIHIGVSPGGGVGRLGYILDSGLGCSFGLLMAGPIH